MKRLFSFIAIILLFFTARSSFAQLPYSETVLSLLQGHLLDGLYGGGNSAAVKSAISNIIAGNPATINNGKGLRLGLSYEISSDISNGWIGHTTYQKNHILFPLAFGLSYSIDKLSVAIGSSQIYNGTLDYGKVRATMRANNEQGYIDIGTIHPVRKDIAIKNSIILNYNLKDLFNLPDEFYLGFACNYNYLRSSFHVKNNIEDPYTLQWLSQEWDIDIFEPSFAVGLKYDFNNVDLRFLKLGMFYESEIEFDKQRKIDGNNWRFIGNIPAKVHAGIAIGFKNSFSVSSKLSLYFWDYTDREFQNQTQAAVSISYLINDSIIPSIGIYVVDNPYDIEDDVFNLNNTMSAAFLTAGFVYKFKQYECDISVADSHLLSDEKRKQTIVRLGLGYTFD